MTNDSAKPIKTAESDRSKPIGIDPAAYEGDIVSRLRNWRGLHLAHTGIVFDEAADEIERLRGYRDEAEAEASIASLAAQRLRLTDAEREAVEWCLEMAVLHATDCDEEIAALRGLLERMK